MEKQKGKLKYNFLKYRNVAIETPVAMDLSTDISRLFRVREHKKKRVSDYMCESIRRTKRSAGVRHQIEYLTLPIRPATAKDFVQFSSKCPSVVMPRLVLKRIKKLINVPALEESHPQILVEIIKEAKELYSDILHRIGNNQKIKNSYPEVKYTLEPYKHVGRTNRYDKYLLARKRLKSKWILHCPIVKKIFKECVTQVPEILCHLKLDGIFQIEEIVSIFKERAQAVAQFVYEFYINILSIVNDSGKISNTSPVTHLFACTGLVSVYVSGALTRTVLHVVRFSGSNKPYMNVKVTFNKDLVLTPTVDDVTGVYHDFIDQIIDSGSEIYVLHRNRIREFENKYMPLCITEEFINDCKRKVAENIQRLYEPIMSYLDSISNELRQIYPEINSKAFIESISDITFQDGCQKINYYREYLNRVAYIPDREYFQIGQTFLMNYRKTLYDGLKHNIDAIFEKLCWQHLWEVSDLCETFQLIDTRASHKSQTTEEVIEIGKYMHWIKNEHLEEITTRVENSVTSLCQIIDLGILTEDHMQLNADVINWLDRISPIVDDHLVLFDQLKYEAEEKLQAVVEDATAAIKAVYPLLVILDDMDDLRRVTSYLHYITLHMNKIKEIEEQIAWINKEEVCLSFPKSTYTEYEDLKSYVFPFYHLLKLCQEIQRNVSVWQDGPFENLDFEKTKNASEAYYKELTELHKTYRKKLRQAQDENLPLRFKGTIDDPDIINWPAPLKLCGKSMKLIDDFKPSVNVTKIICNSSLRKRHWKAMSEIAGVDITPNAGTTLRKMMKIDFYANLNEYEIISTGATKEKQLIDNLKVLQLAWTDIEFCVTKFKGTNILSHLDEIEAVIDDHSIKILNMKGSVFVKPHEKEVTKFYGKIRRVSTTIDVWTKVQSEWIRLLPILSTKNLKQIIPKESELFEKVMLVYNVYIDKILEKRNVMKIVETTDILKSMEICLVNIEIVHKGVNNYLETVRHNFPRFYFLSDDELLFVLTEPRLKSQLFLKKIFTGIREMIIEETEITAMKSSSDEIVNFMESIDLQNNIKLEELCSHIEQSMISSLKHNITECYKIFRRSNVEQVLLKFPQQVIQVTSQIFWSNLIKNSLGLTHNIKLRIYYQKLDNTVKDKIRMLKENCMTNLDLIKLRNLIIDDLNLRFLVRKILESSYISENQLDWEAHAKYYYENGEVTILILNSRIGYMYEYLGNISPIIMTPLTDRCYRTLINAQQMHFNGLLQGPSDSGKSEIIKSLSATFGMFLLTFSCFKNLSISIVMNLLIGSCLCGSWLCWENINLLELGVLSVVAQNLFTVLSTIKSGLNKFCLGGTDLKVREGWFVTACIKNTYLNREIPDNLRVLFRTTTLISPDIEHIIETTCYSLGMSDAKSTSRKIICIYNTYQDLIKTRSHYYFGVSTLKELFHHYEQLRSKHDQQNEESIMFNSIKAIFSPAMCKGDLKIMDDILLQVFPNVDVFIESRKDIDKCVSKYCDENNLQFNRNLLEKTIEVYDSLKRRTGVVVIGETFTGKTTVLNICECIFTQVENKPVLKSIVNPDSLSYTDLYGNHNSSSLQCSEGVLSKTIRNFSIEEEHSIKWLIFDGNIGPFWTENVNDILNKDSKFYLASGETFTLNNTNIIFEVNNLDNASPSTINRCGLIYLAPSTITWKDYVKSWITSCKSEWIEDFRGLVTDLLNWIIPPCLNFIKNTCTQIFVTNNINLVRNMIHLTHLILDGAFVSILKKDEDIKNLFIWIQATLIIAGLAGIGALLDKTSMSKFDEFYKLLWKGQNEEHPYPTSFEKLEVLLPQDGLLCNYQYLFKQRGIWKLHQDLLKNEKIMEHPYMNGFLVPTADTLKYSTFLTKHINHQYPVIIVGPSDTGKSILIEHNLLHNVDREKYEVAHISFNCNTNSEQTQRYILSKLNKRKGGKYSPPNDKNFLLFIDNLNLVTIDQHNSSGTLELLRKYLDNAAWYDLKNYNPIHLENINIISALNPTEMRKKMCNRFLRHFNIFSINELCDDTISRIYSNTLVYTWKKAGFSGDINNIISQIVTATTRTYHSILTRFKSTLQKSYYIFSLSNFVKVINTCANLKKEIYDNNKKIYVNLWSHEIQRVFGDRLNDAEFEWLLEHIRIIIKEEFNEEEKDAADPSSDSNCKFKTVFSTFNDRDLPNKERRYEELTDLLNLQNIVTDSLKVYNYSHVDQLDIILFTYALDKLLKICRVISTSQGNALLLGELGSGRQSLTKLACHLYKQDIFQPTLTTNYTVEEWNRDVKSVLKGAGGLEKETVFLVTEEQLIDEQFLQNLDLMLRNGEIPNLYNSEEKQEILELARLAAQGGNRNLDITSESVFLYFHKRCKENLHLVLCHRINSDLRNRIRKHPSLMGCHVIWFDDWPDESYEFIAQAWTKDLNVTEDIKQKITNASIFFYREMQIFSSEISKKYKLEMHITSKRFIQSIQLFIELTNKKQKETDLTKKRYEQGLARLSHASNQILNMQKSLAEYQPQLEEMTQRAIEMTEQIALETIQVEKASALVREDEKVAGKQAAVAQILKSECETELAQAIPILEDAISALNTLKPTDITLVKSMKNPPDAIKLVMAAVCVIKDVKPERLPDPSTGRKTIDYWGPSKRILGDMNFLQTLKDFDKDNIKPEIMVKIRKEYLPHKDFKPNIVAKASSAAEGLCKWIIAMDMYDKVAKEVAPKKEKLEKAEREYAETMAVLNEKKEELTRLEKKLAELNDFLEEATQKQRKLQEQVDYCKTKLQSAQKLIESLSEERSKWTEAAKRLECQYNLLPGNLLIFSGIVSYLAPLNEDLRKYEVNIWHGHMKDNVISFGTEFDIINLLSTEKEIQFWNRNEIPNDDFFIMNATIRKYSHHYSIFIDPNYKASNWVLNIERKNKIIVTKLTEDYLYKLTEAISNGKPILIHKIGECIPPCLTKLLQRQTFFENGDTFVKLNNEAVKMNENFRLYMTSNLNSPCFSPEMYNRITLINFKITAKALEKDLQKIVVEIEKPELKNRKRDISMRNKRNHAELLELEDKILNTLCESETDILENEAAIKILDDSKSAAKRVRESQKETELEQEVIDKFNAEYMDLVKYSANLFSCVDQLKNLNNVYEFSLSWYMDQYFISVLNAGKSKDPKKRCSNIRSFFTYKLFVSIKNCLLQSDQLVFLFLLSTCILLFEEKIVKEDLEMFLKTIPYGKEPWVDTNVLKCLEQIDGLKSLNGFLNNFKQNINFWKIFFEKSCLDLESFPSPWNSELGSFQRLIPIKLLRHDQLFHNVKKFLLSQLGEMFVNAPHVNLFDVYNDSYSLSPIIIFLQSGINVTQKLRNLAHRKQMMNRFKVISLSEDQACTIDNLIEEARNQGSWILVENCHVVPKWVLKLEESIIHMNVENTHENFRLWLTLKPSKNLPVELLQHSVKISIEEPESIKNKLKRIYQSEPVMNTEFYDGCPEKLRYFSRLLYAVSFTHCVLQVKRNFGIISTKTPYIFSDDELIISQHQLQLFVNENTFNCKYLNKLIYFIGKCHFSGYADNEWDIRLVETLLKDFLSSAINKSKCMFNSLNSYGLPRKNDCKDYFIHISKLPEEDDPKLFGLNQQTLNYINEERSYKLLSSVLHVLEQQREISLSEKLVDLLSKIDNILQKLLQLWDDETETTENIVIKRETNQYNLLINIIRNSLVDLKKGINGDTRVTKEDEEVAQSITDNRVPSAWSIISYPHQMNLGEYIEDLSERLHFFKKLVRKESKCLWLAAFFFPKSFICQIRIDFSKKEKVPLENVLFDYKVLHKLEVDEPVGKIFNGLFIKGAIWDKENSRLGELKNLYDNFPPILFKPINVKKHVDGNRYVCPVIQADNVTNAKKYLQNSHNFICTVLLPTDSNSDLWEMNGIKIFCQRPNEYICRLYE